MNKLTLSFFLICSVSWLPASTQTRNEIHIPDILGYRTLKCDFHVHTIFSDGDVWPTTRIEEAWADGLDAISITDHIEYRPHSQDIDSDHNRSFEIAQPLSERLGIILIRGAEITRQMPPGHLNAVFLKNANLIERESWWEACVEAREQGAFVFWNHPGWKVQQPETTRWWPEHTNLVNAGIMKGVEVYNSNEFYPEALKWADENKLTIFANSDIHPPVGMLYQPDKKHRPVTLVFATDRSPEAIKLALFDGRTAAYFGDTIMGDRRFLTPLFMNSIEIKNLQGRLTNQGIKAVSIYNHSDVAFRLRKRQPSIGFTGPDKIVLPAHRTVIIDLEGTSDEVSGMENLRMFYEVDNLVTLKGARLQVNIEVPNK